MVESLTVEAEGNPVVPFEKPSPQGQVRRLESCIRVSAALLMMTKRRENTYNPWQRRPDG